MFFVSFFMLFRIMIIRILNTMKKDIEMIKKDKAEIKTAIFEINKYTERNEQ